MLDLTTDLIPSLFNGSLRFTAFNQDSEECLEIVTLDDSTVEAVTSFNLQLDVDDDNERIDIQPQVAALVILDNDRMYGMLV